MHPIPSLQKAAIFTSLVLSSSRQLFVEFLNTRHFKNTIFFHPQEILHSKYLYPSMRDEEAEF